MILLNRHPMTIDPLSPHQNPQFNGFEILPDADFEFISHADAKAALATDAPIGQEYQIEVCDPSHLRPGDILIFSAPPMSTDVALSTRALQRIQALYVQSSHPSDTGYSTDLHTATIAEISAEHGPIIVHVMGRGLLKEPLSSYDPKTPYFVFRVANHPSLAEQIAQSANELYSGVSGFHYSFALPSFLHILYAHTRPTIESVEPKTGSYSGLCVGFTAYALQIALRNYASADVSAQLNAQSLIQNFMPLNSAYVTTKSFADFMRRSPYYKKLFCNSNASIPISQLIQSILFESMQRLSLMEHILMCGAVKQWIVFKEIDIRRLREYYPLGLNISVQTDIVQNRELATLVLFLQWFVSHSGLDVSVTHSIVRSVYGRLCVLPEFFVWDRSESKLICKQDIQFDNPIIPYKVQVLTQLQQILVNFVAPVLFEGRALNYVSELMQILSAVLSIQNNTEMIIFYHHIRTKNVEGYPFRALLSMPLGSIFPTAPTTAMTPTRPAIAAEKPVSVYQEYLALLPKLIEQTDDANQSSRISLFLYKIGYFIANQFQKTKSRFVENAYRIFISAVNGSLTFEQAIDLIDRFPSCDTESFKIINDIKYVLKTTPFKTTSKLFRN